MLQNRDYNPSCRKARIHRLAMVAADKRAKAIVFKENGMQADHFERKFRQLKELHDSLQGPL